MSQLPIAVGDLVTPAGFMNRCPQLLGSHTLVSDGNFPAITVPAGFSRLTVVISGRRTAGGVTNMEVMRVNGDATAGRYAGHLVTVKEGAAPAVDTFHTSETAIRVGWIPGADALPSRFGHIEVTIEAYSRADRHKTFTVRGTTPGAASSQVGHNSWTGGGYYVSSNPITTVDVANTHVAGSYVEVYGHGQAA